MAETMSLDDEFRPLSPVSILIQPVYCPTSYYFSVYTENKAVKNFIPVYTRWNQTQNRFRELLYERGQ